MKCLKNRCIQKNGSKWATPSPIFGVNAPPPKKTKKVKKIEKMNKRGNINKIS